MMFDVISPMTFPSLKRASHFLPQTSKEGLLNILGKFGNAGGYRRSSERLYGLLHSTFEHHW